MSRGSVGSRGAAGAIAPAARRAWENAGGSAPSLGGIYPVDTAGVAPNLGTSPSILSTWNEIGAECFATARIHSGSGSPTSGEGYWTLNGLPRAPKMVGAGNDGGQIIGVGMLLDITNGGRLYHIRVVADPAFSATKPIFFVADTATTVDKAGDQDATVWAPRSFATPLPIAHGAGAAYPTYGTLAADPFDLAGGFILNCTLQYEGV